MTKKAKVPGLFGQKHSSRDYTKEKSWGKMPITIIWQNIFHTNNITMQQ